MVAVSSMSPEEVLSYSARQSAANQNLLTNKATNQYQRALQNIQYGQQTGDYERAANRARVSLPTQYLKNGTFNSGLYRNALSQYAVDRLNGLRNMATNYQMGQLNSIFQDRASEDNYANTSAQIEAEKYARQAALASMLRENM